MWIDPAVDDGSSVIVENMASNVVAIVGHGNVKRCFARIGISPVVRRDMFVWREGTGNLLEILLRQFFDDRMARVNREEVVAGVDDSDASAVVSGKDDAGTISVMLIV